ncbi:MAG: NAD-dependent epimerase/dehydratase family protein [Candidatus Omnitrophota bacterium]
MKDKFWENKRILVTGYEGFLGSWLTRALLQNGAKVVGLDKKVRRKDTILNRDELKRIKMVKGRVENAALIKNILQRERVEFIFHLAAESLVGRCLKNPCAAFSTNIRGTWNILEQSRRYGKIRGIIVASSDKAYGEHLKLPYREEFALKGDHPYDASKSCADLLANTYANTFKLPVCVTRCGNIFGAGDFNFSRLIPDAICCAVSGKTLKIRSNGKFIRDYIYVKDIVAGYLLLGRKMYQKNLSGKAFNFSDERPLSVLQMVKLVGKAASVPLRYEILNQAQYEIKRQYLCSAAARRILRWRPRYSLSKALQETVAWYKSRGQREK